MKAALKQINRISFFIGVGVLMTGESPAKQPTPFRFSNRFYWTPRSRSKREFVEKAEFHDTCRILPNKFVRFDRRVCQNV
jgi:hypothetical protein